MFAPQNMLTAAHAAAAGGHAAAITALLAPLTDTDKAKLILTQAEVSLPPRIPSRPFRPTPPAPH